MLKPSLILFLFVWTLFTSAAVINADLNGGALKAPVKMTLKEQLAKSRSNTTVGRSQQNSTNPLNQTVYSKKLKDNSSAISPRPLLNQSTVNSLTKITEAMNPLCASVYA